ncbi:hypothetical protein [Aromatoleum bremense]|nr:hypothetical protein [Aromatoleum bremense]QTQ32639.1 Uncharacterized protein pbN1_26500 [Aromatoleum bremense]
MMTFRPPQYPFIDILHAAVAVNWHFIKKPFVKPRLVPADKERR